MIKVSYETYIVQDIVETMHKSRPPCRIVGRNLRLIIFSIILVQIQIAAKHINAMRKQMLRRDVHNWHYGQ